MNLDAIERDVPVYAGCSRVLVAIDAPDVNFDVSFVMG
jgi:hypothetical protein